MKIKSAELEKVCVSKENYPKEPLPEFAFAGRSNVGKSSFINSMLNRKNLARTSQSPGKTRTVNFYRINDEIRFVDLPGYGYARVSKSEKSKWSNIIGEYLNEREELLEVFLFVDIRHEPTELDAQMYDFIKDSGFTGIVIATKSDKLSKNKIQRQIRIIADKLKIENTDMIVQYSSVNRDMVDEMWMIIEDLLEFHRT